MPIDKSTPYRYWAFISYSSADRPWARWLHRAIETYGIPARLIQHPTPAGDPAPKHLRPVFHDRAELPAASDLGEEIEDALSASRYLIVVCSPQAARSRWVDREIETFQRLHGPGRVFALIVDGKVHSGDERECLPASLLAATPIAADVRPGGDGKRNAKLKLLAGMLGVGFDELKQRDTQRRFRRLQIGIATALAVAAALAGLAVYADSKRAEAVNARQRAESIMEFLLYDLGNELQPLGQLDIVESVQEQVDAYYADLGIEPSDPYARRNQAMAYQRKGDLLLAQGTLSEALGEFRSALAIWMDLVSSDPADLEIRRNLAVAHDRVGRTLQAQGNLTGALDEYRAALAIRDGLLALDPDNVDLKYEISTSQNLLATALWEQGDTAGALEGFRASLAIKQSLSQADPDDLDLQYAVALEHSNVGSLLDQSGDTETAQEEYRAGLVIMDGLVASDFTNTSWQRLRAALHNNMGVSLEVQGDHAAGLDQYQQAQAIMQALVASDPSNAGWQADLEMYQANVESARQADSAGD